MDFIGIFSTRQSERRQCLIVVLKGEAYAGSDLPINIHLIRDGSVHVCDHSYPIGVGIR